MHKSSGMCPDCGGACKMAKGGQIKGVHESKGHGESEAGDEVIKAKESKEFAEKSPVHAEGAHKRAEEHLDNAKHLHKTKLWELKKLPKPNLEGLYEGGEVKGVHKSSMEIARPGSKKEKSWAGESKAGEHAKIATDYKPSFKSKLSREEAVESHHKVLGEMSSMPNPKLKGLAHGGKVFGTDMDAAQSKSFMEKGEFTGEADGGKIEPHDTELMDACCGELLDAIESKNKSEILESLKAIILSMGK